MKQYREKICEGIRLLAALAVLLFLISGCGQTAESVTTDSRQNAVMEAKHEELAVSGEAKTDAVFSSDEMTGPASEKAKTSDGNSGTAGRLKVSDIPKYSGEPYVVVNENQPSFSKKEIKKKSFEKYSNLDSYGRCGVAVASVGKDIMPTEKRGAIGQVKPSGWHTVKYDCVDGKYLYNRCHLLGYQLTGENANEKNLITGTRYLNVDGMLPFEDMVADYVKETGNHVMYRVTPVYKGKNLLASGVEMEGYSVEDAGEGICFHVYCYNVQPEIEIDYATGESKSVGKTAENHSQTEKSTKSSSGLNNNTITEYVLNLNTHKFHLPSCRSVKQMSNANKGTYTGNRQDLIEQGYEPCKICNP